MKLFMSKIFIAWVLLVAAALIGSAPSNAQVLNPNPSLAAPEAGRGGAGAMEPEQLIRQFDRDGDSRISRNEAPERMKARWDQIDTDHDGYVALEELKARDARVGRTENQSNRGRSTPAGGQPRQQPGDPSENSASFQPSSSFSVITLGTSGPEYSSERSGPSTIVQYQGRYFIVDMGNGTQAGLSRIGISLRQIEGIIITHHHLDHNEEFIPIVLFRLLRGGNVDIIGPSGTAKLTDFARDFYTEDISYRLRRRDRTMADLGHAVVREVKGGEVFELGAVKVATTQVKHSIYTIAYRFDAGGQSIVISGDLTYSDSLIELARNADVLVIDSGGAIVRKGAVQRREASGTNTATSRPGGKGGNRELAHASLQEVSTMAQKAGVRRLVLTHISMGEVDEEATRRAVGEIYKGEVIVGHDLLEIVPAGRATSTAAAPAALVGQDKAEFSGNTRIFVNAASTNSKGNGQSWTTAFTTIQAGLDAAEKQGGEIWVAKGTYKPTSGTDRNASIQLRSGVALYGGFAGIETRLEQRDWERNPTLLSGDIGEPGNASDNAYHVVTGANDAVLDGFIITGGNGADARRTGPPPGIGKGGAPRMGAGQIHTTPDAILSGVEPGFGAGMVNYRCAPTIRNCVFQDNRAGKGGAVYNMVSREFPPRPDATTAMPHFNNCAFIGNYARARGGAVANDLGTSPVFENCRFLNNSTDDKGGGMYDDFACSPTLKNCLFVGNSAYQAGALGNDGSSCPLLINCTFAKNRASDIGAALYQGSGPANNPILINCILWDNTCDYGPGEISNWHDCEPVVSNSCVRGGYPGLGNMDVDPKFVAPDKGDYRLAAESPCPHAGYTAHLANNTLPTNLRRFAPTRDQGKPNLAPPEKLPAQAIVYVNAASAVADQDGKSWATAYRSLQRGLDHAWKCGGEVWAANGTYQPTESGERSISFQLRSGVAVYGGFGGTETQREQRNWHNNATILDGKSSYHVLIGCDHAQLDGFTITGGNADGQTYDAKGGGLINYHRSAQGRPNGPELGYSPTIANCRFVNNRAIEGGAIYSFDRGIVELINCVFENNSADNGGAIVDRVGVKTTLTNCAFVGNTAKWRGGAIYLDYGARATLTGCRLENNSSGGHGGAIYTLSRASQLENTTATLAGCTFTGNRAKARGGAIANTDSTLLTASNCSFSRNQAGKGGGAVSNDHRGQAVLQDCRYEANHAETGLADVDRESLQPARPQ